MAEEKPPAQGVVPGHIESAESVMAEAMQRQKRAEAALRMTASEPMHFSPVWPRNPGWYWVTLKLSEEGTYGSPRPGMVKIEYQRSEDGKLVYPLIPIAAEVHSFYDDNGEVAHYVAQAPDPNAHFSEPLPECIFGGVVPLVHHWSEEEG
jgi:hypothetical protein